MLGAFAFPRPFDWAILVEKRQRDAYLAVEKMLQSLGLWSLIGVAVAVAGAIAAGARGSAGRSSRSTASPAEVAQGQLRGPGRRACARATRSAISPGA